MPGNNSTATPTFGTGTEPYGGLPGNQPANDITVTQGPDWLVNLYFSPPSWVNPVLKIVALLAVVVVAYRLYQWDGDIPLDTQREMLIVASTIVGVVTATLGLVNLTTLSYWLDVTGGFCVGYGAVLALQVDWVGARLPAPQDRRERLTAAWILVGVAAVGLPELVSTRGVGLSLMQSRFILAGIAFAMTLVNSRTLLETDDR